MANPESVPIPNLFIGEDAKRVVTENQNWGNTLGFLAELTFLIRTVPNPTEPLLSLNLKDYIPPPASASEAVKYYTRNLEISGLYAGTDESEEKIGRKFSITRERVRQIFTKTLQDLHDNAPLELREKYPLKSLFEDKRSSIEAKMRLSRARGGNSIRVAEALEAGMNNRQIMAKLGLTIYAFDNARKTLRGWGIEVPYQEGILDIFGDLKKTDLVDEKVQALLNKVNNQGRYDVLRKAGLMVNLSFVAKSAGLHVTRNIYRVYDALKQEKIPIGRVPHEKKGENGEKKVIGWYYFIATMSIQEAVAILESSSELADLKINPVKLFTGSHTIRLPNTNDLVWSGNYNSVGNLIGEIRGAKSGRGRHRIKTFDILKGSPVQVYQFNNRFFYAKEGKKELTDFLSRRLVELGLMK